LRREGWQVNLKRVYRLYKLASLQAYKLEGLSLRLKQQAVQEADQPATRSATSGSTSQ
jgi:hypothetical protein